MLAHCYHRPNDFTPFDTPITTDLGDNYRTSRDFFMSHWKWLANVSPNPDEWIDMVFTLEWTK